MHDVLLLKDGVYSKLVRKQLKTSITSRIKQLMKEDNDTDVDSSSQASGESLEVTPSDRKYDDTGDDDDDDNSD